MREIPAALSAAFDSGAVRLCQVWILTRADGVKQGFTDHDKDLHFQGVTCAASSGWTAGAARSELGLDNGDRSVSGVLSDVDLRAEDIRAGLYDGAQIDTYAVDWRDSDIFVPVSSGTLARIEMRGQDQAAFVAHVEGPAARLQRIIGRRYTPLCDAQLGDARCGLSDPVGTCDKRYATCRDVFANIVHFRGFPDLPGEDFITLYPRSGDALDGASRGGTGRL